MVVGALAENTVPEDPALKFTKVGDLFWLLPVIRPVRSNKIGNIMKKMIQKVSKFGYVMMSMNCRHFVHLSYIILFITIVYRKTASFVKQFCNRTNLFITMFNAMLQVRNM